MAKKFIPTNRQHQTGRTITTKTPYGSTSDMIVTDEQILSKVKLDDGCVLLKDDEGYYITNKGRINDGLADPLRCCPKYREVMSKAINRALNEDSN